jgi:hypothetical protein
VSLTRERARYLQRAQLAKASGGRQPPVPRLGVAAFTVLRRLFETQRELKWEGTGG